MDFSSQRPGTLALKSGNELLRLHKREMIIGRAEECDLSIPSGMVSRRHARLLVSVGRVTIEDLGSRNGVLVNSEVIRGAHEIKAGDSVVLGDQTFEVVTVAQMRNPTQREMRVADTLIGTTPGPAETTHQGDVFELLGTVVDKQLALGHGSEAEKLLRGHLERLLANAESGAGKDPQYARAAGYSLKLAVATGKAEWIDYAFKLYRTLGIMLPRDLIDELFTILRKVRGVRAPLLREYVALMQGKEETLSPTERFLLQRLAGLDRLIV
jgi:pSer/pThr/pTyr-binding forkhead associated (FHA) protein